MSTAITTATKPAAVAAAPAPAEVRMPSHETFKNIFRKAVSEDKPVLFDYWVGSLDKSVAIGVQEIDGKKEKILIRRDDEYTSTIANIFRSGQEFIVITENSIYVVDTGIPVRKIPV